MTTFLKCLNYIIPAIVIGMIIFFIIKSNRIEKEQKEILANPLYLDAEITDIVPGTPTPKGVVNITLSYRYTTPEGEVITKENVLTAIKTMDLQNFKIGTMIPIICLKNDPRKSMLKMKNALDE